MKRESTQDKEERDSYLDWEHVVDGLCVLLAGRLLEAQTGGAIRPFEGFEREVLSSERGSVDRLRNSREFDRVA